MFKSSLSVFSARTMAALFLLAMASCSYAGEGWDAAGEGLDNVGDKVTNIDVGLPKVFGSEVPDEVLKEPRAVPVPPPPGDTVVWPKLTSVPFRPKDFTPEPVIEQTKKEMQNDRDAARLLQQNYQAAPPVLPVAP